MKRNLFILALGALLCAGQAGAMQAHRFIDDHRSSVVLPGDNKVVVLGQDAAMLVAAAEAQADADTALTIQATPRTATPAPASPVPEPSGIAMLACGLLLLLLAPGEKRHALLTIARKPRPM